MEPRRCVAEVRGFHRAVIIISAVDLVCINLEKFVQRSSGIFGATGTGKSFLTRILLAGLIHYNKASVLVFDMHNEYGFDDTASDTNQKVTGLRTKFGSRVRVVGLGAGLPWFRCCWRGAARRRSTEMVYALPYFSTIRNPIKFIPDPDYPHPHAADVLDHQRHRGGLHQLGLHQAHQRQVEGSPPAHVAVTIAFVVYFAMAWIQTFIK